MNKWVIFTILIIVAFIIFALYTISKSVCFFGCDNDRGCSKEYTLTVNRLDPLLCDQLTTPYNSSTPYRNTCRERCVAEIAFKNRNVSQCDLISPATNQSFSYKSSCYTYFAYRLNDSSLCDHTESSHEKKACLTHFGIQIE